MYPSFPFQDDRNFEIYTVEIETEGKLNSEGHKEGTEEFITVFEGELTIKINDCQYKLNSGDSIRFKADRPHSYRNFGRTQTRLNMTIYYSTS